MDARAPEIRLSEVISALSYALDVTEGQPVGHAARTCVIGMRLAEAIGLDGGSRSSLFYALLLKDAGCSSNAAKVAALLGGDDHAVKRDRKTVDHRRTAQSLRHLGRNLRPDGSPMERAGQLVELVRRGLGASEDLYALRCERGAQVARSIELDDATAAAIRALDEHWDGGGAPYGLAGEQIPVLGRILGLAQTFEVFLARDGLAAGMAVARERRDRWFDPALVDALLALEGDRAFWARLERTDPQELVRALEPEDRIQVAESDRLDRVAEAFAGIVDAKSPYTGRHSDGVARISVGIGAVVGLTPTDLRDLRRAALLHDLGKLGVSNRILDKPGRLTEAEWAAMRRHPELTEAILLRVSAFRELAATAGAHHERLDGTGYHRGLRAPQLGFSARALAVADVFEALTARRPYRGPLAPEEALAVMRADVPDGLDPHAFEALEAWALGPASPLDERPVAIYRYASQTSDNGSERCIDTNGTAAVPEAAAHESGLAR